MISFRHTIRTTLALLAATAAPTALAASILVNTLDDELNDDGDCSLREAVESANTNPVSGVDDCNAGNAGSDTITVLVSGTITLSGELTVTEALSIQGLGAEATILDGNGTCSSESTDLPMTDPELFPPADYGDSVPGLVMPTMLPKPDSPVVEGGASSCPGAFSGTTFQDQRGQTRPVTGTRGTGERCDNGAVEYQPGSDPVARSLTVSLAGSITGQVISDPSGINCPGLNCTAEFPDGKTVELTALTGPEPGTAFAGWGGDCSGAGTCLPTFDSNKSVTAPSTSSLTSSSPIVSKTAPSSTYPRTSP